MTTTTTTCTFTIRDLIVAFRSRNASPETIEWLSSFDPDAPAETAWQQSADGVRLLWWCDWAFRKYTAEMRRAAINIVREIALPHASASFDVCQRVIDVAERYMLGDASAGELAAAKDAAAIVKKTVDNDAEWATVRACMWVAAGDVAGYAAHYAASGAVGSHVVDAANDAARARSAEIVRANVKWGDVVGALTAADDDE